MIEERAAPVAPVATAVAVATAAGGAPAAINSIACCANVGTGVRP